MAYSDSWNVSVPANTKEANLLGDYIRELKSAISERIASFGAGLAADRPTPEGDFGSASYGVLYYATDTGELSLWNGTTWSVIQSSVIYADSDDGSVGTGVADTNTTSIPGDTFRPGTRLDILLSFRTDNAGSVGNTLALYVKGNPLASTTWNASLYVSITLSGLVIDDETLAYTYQVNKSDGTAEVGSGVYGSLTPLSTATIIKGVSNVNAGNGNKLGLSVLINGDAV